MPAITKLSAIIKRVYVTQEKIDELPVRNDFRIKGYPGRFHMPFVIAVCGIFKFTPCITRDETPKTQPRFM